MKWPGLPLVVAIVVASHVLGAEVERRLPVPDAKSQAAADTTIKSLFKTEFAKASPADRDSLASKLLKVADEPQSDAGAEYVLLHDAQELSAQTGNVDTMMQAVDAIADKFEVDALQYRIAALLRIASNARTPQSNAAVARAALHVCDEASSAEQYDAASRVVAVADSAAARSRDKQLVASVKETVAAMQRDRQEQQTADEAAKKLLATPDDAEAHLALGKHLCFVREEWEKGLPHLAAGPDAQLQTLAKLELAAPKQAAAMQKLGDGWWQWAMGVKDPEAAEAKARAANWYMQAMPDLAGLSKTLARKRIDQAASAATSRHHTVDLMPLIDLHRDVVSGSWTQSGKILSVAPADYARLRIRYQPPPEYDFRVTFIRRSDRGAVVQLLWHDDRTFFWFLGAGENTEAGFGLIGEHGTPNNPTQVSNSNGWLHKDQKHVSEVKVRGATVTGFLDGKLVSNYRTDYSDLFMQPEWSIGKTGIGLGEVSCTLEFEKVEIIEVTGHGKQLSAGD